MRQITSEQDLLETLKTDLSQTHLGNVLVLAGHFPIIYKEKDNFEQGEAKGTATISFEKWGIFSDYSLNLGCQLTRFAQENLNKQASLLLLADDHTYQHSEMRNGSLKRGKSWEARARNQLYKQFSGQDSKLPYEITHILETYGLSENDVLLHNHKKNGREDCLFWSEKVLQAQAIDDPAAACSKAYAALLSPENLPKDTYLISFIPQKCNSSVCNSVLDVTPGVQASHVFMTTEFEEAKLCGVEITPENLYSSHEIWNPNGVLYRKDS